MHFEHTSCLLLPAFVISIYAYPGFFFLFYFVMILVLHGTLIHTKICYVHTQLFLALYMCVFILNGSPAAIFRTGFSFVEYCCGSFRAFFFNLITRNYATNFNVNFLEVSLLIIRGNAPYILAFTI